MAAGPSRIVAALGQSSWLFDVRERELARVANLGFPAPSGTVRIDDGRIITIAGGARYFLLTEPVSTRSQQLPLPAGMRATSIAAWRNWVFVAGVRRAAREELPDPRWGYEPSWLPVLFAASFRSEVPAWHPIYPVELGGRKAIDAVLVDSNRLYAVDNVLIPKYLVVFDLTDDGPRHPAILHLPLHDSWESIIAAAVAPGRLAILSNSASRDGQGTFLSVLDLTTFAETHLLSRRDPWPGIVPRALAEGMPLPVTAGPALTRLATDVALLDNVAVLACGKSGLGVVGLTAGTGPPPQEPLQIKPIDWGDVRFSWGQDVQSLNLSLQSYHPDALAGLSVNSVRVVLEAKAVLATGMDDEKRLHSVLIGAAELVSALRE